MSLPFMKKRQVAALIIQNRTPDGVKTEGAEDSQDQGLMSCAEDLIRAVHAKDAQAVASAMRAAFEILESEPHEEAEQSEPSESEES